jgi:dTDP-4-amino-4,6-dideoxygalactose transaminase
MQAVIGRRQLAKLPGWTESRRRNAAALTNAFSRMPFLRVPTPPSHVGHACYRFYAFVQPDQLAPNWDRDRIMVELNERGIPCTVGSCSEIYLEKAFVDRGWAPTERLPVSRELGATSLMFLVHPTLPPAAVEQTIDAMQNIAAYASR